MVGVAVLAVPDGALPHDVHPHFAVGAALHFDIADGVRFRDQRPAGAEDEDRAVALEPVHIVKEGKLAGHVRTGPSSMAANVNASSPPRRCT